MKKPRCYQRKAVDAVYNFYRNSNKGYPLIALPTATGKAMCIALMFKEIYTKNPSLRLMMITHNKELVSQNRDELLGIMPNAPLGVYCSGLGSKDIDTFTFASIQSVAKIPEAFGKIDVVIIDEVQICNMSDETQYKKFLDGLMQTNPNLRVIGLSATLWRMTQGMLTDNGLFTDIVCDLTLGSNYTWFEDNGYLTKVVSKSTVTTLDVSDVKKRGGEFISSQLQKACDKSEVTYAAICEALPYLKTHDCAIVFATGIEHAIHITEMLVDEFGISAICVHSKMTDVERDKAITDFKAGKYKVIVNKDILTTGFNHPPISLMIDLAPTRSSGLFVQKVGRITRAYYAQGYDVSTVEGRLQAISKGKKPVAVLLDYAGNTMANGKINQPRIPKKKGESDGTGDAPIKACPKCLALIYASARICNTHNPFTGELCDFEFEFKTRLQTSASSVSVVARDEPPIKEWIDVKSVAYSIMKSKKDGIPMLVVSYSGFLKTYKEYICLEHTGFAGSQASVWWRMRYKDNRVKTTLFDYGITEVYKPTTVAEALEHSKDLKAPKQIYVHLNAGKYPKIESYNFGDINNS